ncbi:MAG: sodium:solute symporter [Lachnospiraceae bacterium]|nr:sodium:solute symporter [Lachnospiraceae bacterium]
MALTIILLICFFALMIGVGLYTRKNSTDVNGFVLGGRSVGPWLTAFAFGTSYFSAVIFVGYAGQFGWNFGLSATWAGLGNAFIGSLLAWNILGRRTRVMTQHLDAKTMPDFFGKRFNSSKLKVAASVIVFIFLIPYTASLYNGLSSLFGLQFDIPYWVVILVMAVLTGVYVIFGGYMATAINDFIQGIIMLIGIAAVIIAVINQNGGLVESMKGLSAIGESTSAVATAGWNGAYASFLGPDPLALLFVVILTSLGTWGLPQMVGKFYAIKSEKDIHKGTVISTVFAIVVAGGCYFLGGFGRLYESQMIESGAINAETGKVLFDRIIPTMLSTLPDIIIAVVIVLVLSASMSTLSSLVLTSSSTFTLDVIKPLSKKTMTEKKQVLIMRIFIVFFIVVSAVIAVIKDANPQITFIAQMMGVSWGALAGAFLAPFLYGLYWKGITKASTIVCFVWGCSIAIFQMVVSLGGISVADWGPVLSYIFKSSINSGVVAMVGGLIIVPVVSMFTKKLDKKDVDGAFECYEEKIEVTKKANLGK